MRVAFAATIFFAVVPAKADLLKVSPNPAGYEFVKAWYTIPEPNLNAGQRIGAFNLKLSLVSSSLGQNGNPGNPLVTGVYTPNPFVKPEPDCTNPKIQMTMNCILTPVTLNGVDPSQKAKALSGEFNFDPGTSSLKKGANENKAGDRTNQKAPAAGYTFRTDSLNLAWVAAGPRVGFFPAKIAAQDVQALTFGSLLSFQRVFWGVPGKNVTKYGPSEVSNASCFWTLTNASTIPCPNQPFAVAMGQDGLDASGNLLAGLAFIYTNEGSDPVDLSNLGFETSMTDLSLGELGLAGTPLSNPQVTLNGSLQTIQSDYEVPPGYTLQILFPDTTDTYFIAQGDISSEGVPQLAFAYEDRVVTTPEPASLLLLATVLTLLYRYLRIRAASAFLR